MTISQAIQFLQLMHSNEKISVKKKSLKKCIKLNLHNWGWFCQYQKDFDRRIRRCWTKEEDHEAYKTTPKDFTASVCRSHRTLFHCLLLIWTVHFVWFVRSYWTFALPDLSRMNIKSIFVSLTEVINSLSCRSTTQLF